MKDQVQPKSPILLIVIASCLVLPFLESWFAGTLWGLNWNSPVFMDQLRDHLRIFKLGLITLSIFLLFTKYTVIGNTIQKALYRRAFLIFASVLAIVQVPLLLLGIMFEAISSSNLDYIHKEKSYAERSIYIYTADPGAMGKAYHYFFLKCPLSFNRYELTEITKTNWMYEYTFEVIDNELIIEDKSENGEIKKFDVSSFHCN